MSIEPRELLRSYGHEVLLAMAEARGLKTAGVKRGALEGKVAEAFFSKEAVGWSLAQLDAAQRQVLDLILAVGGQAESDRLRSQIIPGWKPDETRQWNTIGARSAKRPLDAFDRAMARLTTLGLAFTLPSKGYYSGLQGLAPGDLVFVPEEVRCHVPQVQAQLGAGKAPASATIVEATPERFLRDAYLYWSAVREASPPLNVRGLVSKRGLRRLNERLLQREDLSTVSTEEEAARLYFLRRTLEIAGWIRNDGQRLVAAPEAESVFRQPAFRRFALFYESWLKGSYWNELLRLPRIYPGQVDIDISANRDRRPGPIVLKARVFVAGLLKDLPAGKWIPVRELHRLARAKDYGFLFPRARGYRGFENPYASYRNPLGWDFFVHDEQEGWFAVEGRFIESVLREPLFWLGVVSLAMQGEELVSVQLTELGARLINGQEPPVEEEAAPESRLIVQPDFQILVFEPVQEHVLAILDRFADRVGTDQVFEYRLTRSSVYRAQQNGMGVDEILGFLSQASSKELPQNVAYSLAEWGQQYERIVMRRRGSLMQVDAPEQLDEILADPAVSGRVLKRISPTALLLQPGGSDAMVRHFVHKDRMSNWIAGPAPVPQAEIAVAPDGTIRFTVPVPSIFLEHRLSQFAEVGQVESERLLTRASIGSAARSGVSAEQVILCLEAYSSEPLPAEVVRAVKAWARHYGAASLEQVTLLSVESEEAAAELQADPELSPFVQRFAPSGTIIRIDPAGAAAVVKRLREMGVEIE